jgi:hypothetical protein
LNFKAEIALRHFLNPDAAVGYRQRPANARCRMRES